MYPELLHHRVGIDDPSLVLTGPSLGYDTSKQMGVNLSAHPFTIEDIGIGADVLRRVHSSDTIFEDHWQSFVVEQAGFFDQDRR